MNHTHDTCYIQVIINDSIIKLQNTYGIAIASINMHIWKLFWVVNTDALGKGRLTELKYIF